MKFQLLLVLDRYIAAFILNVTSLQLILEHLID